MRFSSWTSAALPSANRFNFVGDSILRIVCKSQIILLRDWALTWEVLSVPLVQILIIDAARTFDWYEIDLGKMSCTTSTGDKLSTRRPNTSTGDQLSTRRPNTSTGDQLSIRRRNTSTGDKLSTRRPNTSTGDKLSTRRPKRSAKHIPLQIPRWSLEWAKVRLKYAYRKPIFDFIFDGNGNVVCHHFREVFTVQMWVILTLNIRVGQGQM